MFFTQVAKSGTRSQTRVLSTPTGSVDHGASLTGDQRAGLIAGTVLGGLLVLAAFMWLILVLLHRKKNHIGFGNKGQSPNQKQAPMELPASGMHEICGEAKHELNASPTPELYGGPKQERYQNSTDHPQIDSNRIPPHIYLDGQPTSPQQSPKQMSPPPSYGIHGFDNAVIQEESISRDHHAVSPPLEQRTQGPPFK